MDNSYERSVQGNVDIGQLVRFLRGVRAAVQPEVEGGFGGRLEAFVEPQRVEATERQNRLRQQFAPDIEALNAAMQESEEPPAGLDSLAQGKGTRPAYDPQRVSRLGIRLAAKLAASGARSEDIRALTGNALQFATQSHAISPDVNTPEGAARVLGAATAMDPRQAYRNIPAMGMSEQYYTGADANMARAQLADEQRRRIQEYLPYEQRKAQAQETQAYSAAKLADVKAATGGYAPQRPDKPNYSRLAYAERALAGDEGAARALAMTGGMEAIRSDLVAVMQGRQPMNPDFQGMTPQQAQQELIRLGQYDILKTMMNQQLGQNLPPPEPVIRQAPATPNPYSPAQTPGPTPGSTGDPELDALIEEYKRSRAMQGR
jgi:hypothetical protein